VLVESDVAVVIKPLDDPFQRRKPATKVVTFMGAGLPVVCTPSDADRDVVTHGETGFFAFDDREWYECLRALVTDASLRERVGIAGRRHVEGRYGVDQLAGEYMALFDAVLSGPPRGIDSRGRSA
jgi:glycosyltransferase involved in cell wall biosynthesis